jgi:hypothetical protein
MSAWIEEFLHDIQLLAGPRMPLAATPWTVAGRRAGSRQAARRGSPPNGTATAAAAAWRSGGPGPADGAREVSRRCAGNLMPFQPFACRSNEQESCLPISAEQSEIDR